jgi:hypothetical protein
MAKTGAAVKTRLTGADSVGRRLGKAFAQEARRSSHLSANRVTAKKSPLAVSRKPPLTEAQPAREGVFRHAWRRRGRLRRDPGSRRTVVDRTPPERRFTPGVEDG